VPELPEVEAVRRRLAPVLTLARIADVDVRRPDLRVPFPRRFRARLVGQTVLTLTRRAKYLLAVLSSRETLIVHLGMSGSFRVDASPDNAAEPDRHDHVVFRLASGDTVTFNDPRRFGLMTLLTPAQLARHPVLSRLGPEPLSPGFDAAALARACRGKKIALKVALLDQRIVAGIGNMWVAEALWQARVSPWSPLGTVTDDELARALVWAQDAMRAAVLSPRGPRAVYRRAGRPCRRCGAAIASRGLGDANRAAYWCPTCQPDRAALS